MNDEISKVALGIEIEKVAGGYLVDTDKLREIVYALGVPPRLSHLIWTRLGKKAITSWGTDSFRLGIDLMELLQENMHWQDHLIEIMEKCRNMNNLPLVMVKGRKVDGSKLRFQSGSLLGPNGIRGLMEGDNG